MYIYIYTYIIISTHTTAARSPDVHQPSQIALKAALPLSRARAPELRSRAAGTCGRSATESGGL